MAKRKQKPSCVRHTRSNQLARQSKPPTLPPDEVTAARIKEIVHPATLNQVHYFHQLGLRERTLNLPVMVALVLSLIWRQFGSVSELLRVLKEEGLLWAKPVEVSQQALSDRLRSLPAELFERLLNDILPQMQARWQSRSRPLSPELEWALQHYQRVWAVDGSTLDALLRWVGLHREMDKHPLAVPLADISLEVLYRSLYFVAQAVHRNETADPISYLAADAKLFGLIKRKRSPSALARLNLTIYDDP